MRCIDRSLAADFVGLGSIGDIYVRAVGLPLALVPKDTAPVLNGALAFPPSLLTIPVLVSLVRPRPLTNLLGRRTPVWLGQRSYSLYLWHLPVLSIAINQVPSAAPIALRLIAAVVFFVGIAAASYR